MNESNQISIAVQSYNMPDKLELGLLMESVDVGVLNDHQYISDTMLFTKYTKNTDRGDLFFCNILRKYEHID